MQFINTLTVLALVASFALIVAVPLCCMPPAKD